MEKTKLKPCPFCGYRANYTETYKKRDDLPWSGVERIGYNIKCSKCRAEMHGKSWSALVKAWNRRANDDAGRTD